MIHRNLITSSLAISFILAALLFTLAACSKPTPAPENKPEPAAKTSPDPTPAAKTELPASTREVAAPQVAGQFYPNDPAQLRAMIQSMLDQADPPALPAPIFGLMCPHAGYVYSGPVAAYAYKALKGTPAHRFVIMGPYHGRAGVPLRGAFVLTADAYRTPLGEVKLDRARAEKLVKTRNYLTTDARVYQGEHSLEVQLPFLQTVIGPDLEVTMIMIGDLSPEQTADLAQALNEVFPEPDTVFIASTDMSHGNYPPYQGTDQIKPVDTHTLELIKAMDIAALNQGVPTRATPLCGGLPVLTLLNLFKLRGGKDVEILHYADTGDATGDHSKVVGYGAAAFLKPVTAANQGDSGPRAIPPADSAAPPPAPFTLTDADKLELLKMARACTEAAVKGLPAPALDTASANLKKTGAAFVTLKNHGELRGCIGTILPDEPLFQCVQRRAKDAAVNDSRFFMNRITAAELPALEIEISVLTPIVPAKPEEIMVGRDGVLLTLGGNRGVFLPQVPGEQGWDHDAYLSNLCHKAGIGDPNCWRSPDAHLDRFEAIVFSETSMKLK